MAALKSAGCGYVTPLLIWSFYFILLPRADHPTWRLSSWVCRIMTSDLAHPDQTHHRVEAVFEVSWASQEREMTGLGLIIEYFAMGLSFTLAFKYSKLFTFRLICFSDVEIYPEAFLYWSPRMTLVWVPGKKLLLHEPLHLPEYLRAGAMFSLK